MPPTGVATTGTPAPCSFQNAFPKPSERLGSVKCTAQRKIPWKISLRNISKKMDAILQLTFPLFALCLSSRLTSLPTINKCTSEWCISWLGLTKPVLAWTKRDMAITRESGGRFQCLPYFLIFCISNQKFQRLPHLALHQSDTSPHPLRPFSKILAYRLYPICLGKILLEPRPHKP